MNSLEDTTPKNNIWKVRTYIFSAAYLRPVQIFARLSMFVRRKVLYRFRAFRWWHSRLTPRGEHTNLLVFPKGIYNPRILEGIADGTFTFLNRRVHLGKPVNWFPQHESQLWLYNLHYFDYVVDLARQHVQDGNIQTYHVFRRLVREWIQSCPVATPIAWDPYPMSLRISNWIKAYTLFERKIREDRSFANELRRSLYRQTFFLENNLEYHLLGNHLIENGRALLLAGMFFADDNADRWRHKGEHILWHELHEQFLDDGGHYERSPMYHQIMLDLYQEVVSVLEANDQVVPDEIRSRVQAMREWLNTVLHPDGEIPLLNDAAFGIAARPAKSSESTVVVHEGLKVLSDSGYFVFRDQARQNFLIFDCGVLGPDYQSGHGHCDALSYELSLAGLRMIVDSGVSNYYGDLNWRTYYRSTRAHSTIVVDGAEQSEIWGRFRVARRARPLEVQWADEGPELAYVYGSHSGYRRLKKKVIHRRWICWVDRRFWFVCDHITGQGWHQVESLIHFHPEVQIVSFPKNAGQGQIGEVKREQVSLKIIPWGMEYVTTYFGETDPIQGWYAPEFGLQLKNHVWGLYKADQLPIWMGYILWPESTSVSAQFSIADEQSCHADVQAADARYHIICSPKEVRLKRK